MNRAKILIPLPCFGFDPTEVAIPWKVLSEAGFDVTFATPDAKKARTDPRMLNGDDLSLLKSVLQARKDAQSAFAEMETSDAFCHPISYEASKETDFDALLLPGGHDKGVKEYLESDLLQHLVGAFFASRKVVGAICHGVVLAARSKDPNTGKSVLYDYKTTALLKSQERLAYNLTRFWLQDYYLTYPEITVEDEVKSALANPKNFITGNTPLLRDAPNHLKRGFFVRDRNYISARWPGDAHNFALEFVKMLNQYA